MRRHHDPLEPRVFEGPAWYQAYDFAALGVFTRSIGLATLVAGLPDRYRAVLILRYMEGLRLEEVAAVLKQPLGTTKSNVHRAVNLLREAISESRRAKRGRP